MTNSSKTYSLRSRPQLLDIPNEFDDQLLQDIKDHSATQAQTKPSASSSTDKSASRSAAKSSNKSAKKDSQSGKVVTRSKKSATKSSVRDEWYDENIFDSKRVKHEVKVKKEAPSDNSIFCVKCNETFNSIRGAQ